MHSPWSGYESESTEINTILAGIPPLAGGSSACRWLGWSRCVQSKGGDAY